LSVQPASKDREQPHAHADRPRGHYRYDIDEDRWWWSDTTYRIHGFEPGEVMPTTALVLAHKHPDDRIRAKTVLAEACVTGEPFASLHRIMDAKGATRDVVLSGYGSRFDQGRVEELAGVFVDVTEDVVTVANDAASAQIEKALVHRTSIEQAKGILAVTLGINPEAAFEQLRHQSMIANVPVRELADRIVARAPLLHVLDDPGARGALS